MILQRSSRHVFLLAITFTLVATFLLYYRQPVTKNLKHDEAQKQPPSASFLLEHLNALPTPNANPHAGILPFTPPMPPKPISSPEKESKAQPPPAAITSKPTITPATITPADQTEALHGIGNITKTFVVSSLKKDDTKWIDKYLPEWEYVKYVTDEPVGNLKVPKNKGNEAMVYLT